MNVEQCADALTLCLIANGLFVNLQMRKRWLTFEKYWKTEIKYIFTTKGDNNLYIHIFSNGLHNLDW